MYGIMAHEKTVQGPTAIKLCTVVRAQYTTVDILYCSANPKQSILQNVYRSITKYTVIEKKLFYKTEIYAYNTKIQSGKSYMIALKILPEFTGWHLP